MFNSKQYTFLLFILISLSIFLRVNIESTHYCSPDSKYYLEVANNYQKGLGFVGPKVFNFDSVNHKVIPLYAQTKFGHPETYPKEYFCVWPLGYPIAIIGTQIITGTNLLWASKILNILLLLIDFILIINIFKKHHLLILSIFGSFTLLEIISYTWSENLFLTFFLINIKGVSDLIIEQKKSILTYTLIGFSLTGMLITRYSSIIYYPCTFIPLWILYKQNFKKECLYLLIVIVISSSFSIAYLFHNYQMSGFLTGIPRTSTQEIPLLTLFHKLITGLLQQLNIIKQLRFANTSELAFYLSLTLLQTLLIVYVYFIFIKNKLEFMPNGTLSTILISYSLLYLAFIISMTLNSTIDPFDYRTLFPFTFPLSIVFLQQIEKQLIIKNKKTLQIIQCFFIFSILMNLPKNYILNLIISFIQ